MNADTLHLKISNANTFQRFFKMQINVFPFGHISDLNFYKKFFFIKISLKFLAMVHICGQHENQVFQSHPIGSESHMVPSAVFETTAT